MRNSYILFAIFALAAVGSVSFALISSSAFAAINCPSCTTEDCTCIIGECSSGIFDVYQSSSTCAGTPTYEFSFGIRNFPWYPPKSGTYYVQALCDDRVTKTACTAIAVKSTSETTTTTKGISTTTTTGTGGGDNTLWIIFAILIIVAVVGFIIYRFFFAGRKGSSKKTYEELYRKWGSRTR